MRLVTIRFSHFCEKARWALDAHGVAYEEEGHLPGFHGRAVRRHSKGGARDRASSAQSTPLLVLDDASTLTDSQDIVRWASMQFGEGAWYPNAEASQWEERFHDRLAIHTRRLAYAYLFAHRPLLLSVVDANAKGTERIAFRWGHRFLIPLLKRGMRIDEDAVERSRQIIDEEISAVSDHLRERTFLVGEAFSAADLAFACAVAPALVVHSEEGFGAPLPRMDDLPADYRALARGWRDTAAGEFALRMFRDHRGQRQLAYGQKPSSAAPRA